MSEPTSLFWRVQICFLGSLNSFLMDVVILLNKSYCNKKEKFYPYDQEDIFFLDEKSILIFLSRLTVFVWNPVYCWFRTNSNNGFIAFQTKSRSSYPEVLLRKGAQEICSKFTAEHLCRSVISIKLESINLQHIFRTPFPRNTSGWLLLKI